jgi:acyl-CoA synthetase (AMP-forming)/AMP-acid ligase II
VKSWNDRVPALREERHFGRPMRCFAERPASLLQMLEEAIARNPDGEALVCGETRLTWAALGERVAAAAGAFAARGVRAGDRIALLLGNRAEFVIAFLGTAWLGAIVVPVSIREQKPGLEYILGHCAAKLVVHEPDLAALLPEGIGKVSPLDLQGTKLLPEKSEEEDTAAILYTSGTTGRPKGAMLANLGIVHSSTVFEGCMGLTSETRALAAVPLSHVTGVIALMTSIVRCAGTLLILPAFKAKDFLDLAERERMTYTLIVPAMYNLCLLEPSFGRRDLRAWRVGGYGGAPMPMATITALAQKLPGLGLMNAYGATETTSPATIMPAEAQAARLDSVGLPVPGAEIKVVDEELWIRGPMVVKGYWENPEATAREFTDGFWRSGDIGSMDAEGYVRVLDRRKDMVNRGGYKVFTAEVESALAEHPAVVESAVLGYPCPVLGERVQAFVVSRTPVPAEELRAFCAARLSDYKVPERFTLRGEPLPRNANGKVLKRALREA